MPIAELSLVALDCVDPRGLAEFYQSIVGGRIEEDESDDGWVTLRLDGCDLGFQLDPDHVAPNWPDGPSHQVHLDFGVPDLDSGQEAVLAVGARLAEVQPEPDRWRVFFDPAGHPFCLIRVEA